VESAAKDLPLPGESVSYQRMLVLWETLKIAWNVLGNHAARRQIFDMKRTFRM